MRCTWATTPLLQAYHDAEWGKPLHDEARLFEFLTLEGAQAGLSWQTVLAKRERYRERFFDFDPVRVAAMKAPAIERLMRDPGLIRNRAKLTSALSNARAFLDVAKEFGSFDAFVWSYVAGRRPPPRPRSSADIPTATPISEILSRDLKARGFRFVGPTIMYAFMQTVGMVNDHLADCSFGDR